MDSKKGKNLNFATKTDIIHSVEQSNKSSVMDVFGIPCNMLSAFLQNKVDIKAKAAEQSRSGACGVRIPVFDNIEKALHALTGHSFVSSNNNVQAAAELNNANMVTDIAGTFEADSCK